MLSKPAEAGLWPELDPQVLEEASRVDKEGEKLLDVWLERIVCITQENRARCGRCYKLFKNVSFLPKHFKKKHPQEVFAVKADASA
eukprot:7989684-Prorocentrum_lima.AAC.1